MLLPEHVHSFQPLCESHQSDHQSGPLLVLQLFLDPPNLLVESLAQQHQFLPLLTHTFRELLKDKESDQFALETH